MIWLSIILCVYTFIFLLLILFKCELIKALIYAVCLTAISIYSVDYTVSYRQKRIDIYLAINNKVLEQGLERNFEILYLKMLFSSKKSELLLSNKSYCYDHPFYQDETSYKKEASICITQLYRSKTTNSFFWYGYAIYDGRITKEYVEPVKVGEVKSYLLENDTTLYIKIFGQPKYY